MQDKRLPTVKQIKKWAKEKGWGDLRTETCVEVRYGEETKEGFCPLLIDGMAKPNESFRTCCAALMELDGYEWRNPNA